MAGQRSRRLLSLYISMGTRGQQTCSRQVTYFWWYTRLYFHLSILFNCFIRYGYLPKPFMQSLIIPLLQIKSGNVTDVDNYRAIAVSTAVSTAVSKIIVHHADYLILSVFLS